MITKEDLPKKFTDWVEGSEAPTEDLMVLNDMMNARVKRYERALAEIATMGNSPGRAIADFAMRVLRKS